MDLRQQRRGLDGQVPFVAFYLLGGLARARRQVAVDPSSAVPTIGASGAIAAVLGGYVAAYPAGERHHAVLHHLLLHGRRAARAARARALVPAAAPVRRVGLNRWGGGGVAYFAHIGGFIFGLAADTAVREQRATTTTTPEQDPGLLRPQQAVLALALALVIFLAYLTVRVSN